MRRLVGVAYKLSELLKIAANGVEGEPAWPAPDIVPVDLRTLADELQDLETQARAKEAEARLLREQLRRKRDQAHALARRIDQITSAMYGETGHQKKAFGIRPIDRTRNAPPVPEAPKLSLSDGAKSGSIRLDWDVSKGAKYQAEAWTADPADADARLIDSQVVGASKATFGGLTTGQRVYFRVRGIAGRKTGPWSEPAFRYVNP